MGDDDRRRRSPRTDVLLALPAVAQARGRLSETAIRAIITQTQEAARAGLLPADEVTSTVERALTAHETVSLSRRPASITAGRASRASVRGMPRRGS